MPGFFQRAAGRLTPGVRTLLGLAIGCHIAVLLGLPKSWLALNGQAFWDGRIWTLFTYTFVPVTLIDSLFQWIFVIWIGMSLERLWSRRELWLYCLIIAISVGLLKVALIPSSPVILAGAAPLVVGLLAAWARVAGHERVQLLAFGDISIRILAIALAAGNVLVVCAISGLGQGALMFSAGVFGWVYLSLRWRQIRSQPARATSSKRMENLEL